VLFLDLLGVAAEFVAPQRNCNTGHRHPREIKSGNCGKNHRGSHTYPGKYKSKRAAVQSELAELQTKLSTFAQSSNTEFWRKIAAFMGSNPDNLQIYFALLLGVLLELLGLTVFEQQTPTKLQ
jgi:hypothetical protein